jgi:hypothetical protein
MGVLCEVQSMKKCFLAAVTFTILAPHIACGSGSAQNLAAIMGSGAVVRDRLMQLLADCPDRDPNMTYQLVNALVRGEIHDWQDQGVWAYHYLRTSPHLDAQKVYDAYRMAGSQASFRDLCITLAILEKKALPVVPVLLEELARQTHTPEAKGWTEAVLAASGYGDGQGIARIRKALEDGNDVGWVALDITAASGIAPWVHEGEVGVLVKVIQKELKSDEWCEGRDSDMATTLVLSMVAAGNSRAIAAISDLRDKAAGDPNTGLMAAACELCLAHMDRGNRANHLDSLASLVGQENYEARALAGLTQIMSITNDNVADEMAERVTSKDSDKVKGAIIVMQCCGRRAQRYVPTICEVLRRGDDAGTRRVAAGSLQYLARPEDVPLLKSLLANQNRRDSVTMNKLKEAIDTAQAMESVLAQLK